MVTAIKVGCCGYPVSTKRYREVFRIVELNNTFYQYPRDSNVEKWRKEAPEDFEFTVKAHQEISHTYKLKTDLAAEAFDKMKRICQTLHAHIMVIQTAGSFKPDRLEDAHEFFRRVEREDLTLVWETRGNEWEEVEVREELRRVLEEVDVSHITDPFRTMPVFIGRTAYFRLHGLGARMYYYQYTDSELERLYDQIKGFNGSSCEVYVLFNNLSMFEDAKRFLHFLEKKKFPSLTGSVGLDSVMSVVERARYPLTKSMLMEKFGWRVVELEAGKQIRLEEILKNLPSKNYDNKEKVIKEIKRKSAK